MPNIRSPEVFGIAGLSRSDRLRYDFSILWKGQEICVGSMASCAWSNCGTSTDVRRWRNQGHDHEPFDHSASFRCAVIWHNRSKHRVRWRSQASSVFPQGQGLQADATKQWCPVSAPAESDVPGMTKTVWNMHVIFLLHYWYGDVLWNLVCKETCRRVSTVGRTLDAISKGHGFEPHTHLSLFLYALALNTPWAVMCLQLILSLGIISSIWTISLFSYSCKELFSVYNIQ